MSLHQPSSALSEFDYGKVQSNSEFSSLGDLVSISGSDSPMNSFDSSSSEAKMNLLSLTSDSNLTQASLNMTTLDSNIGSFDFSDFDKGFEDFTSTDKAEGKKEPLDLKTYENDSFGAYSKALDEGKYTAILFKTDLCVFCKNLEKNMGDASLGKYADKMIASVTDGDKDKGARQLEEALGVVRYPTLVILKTNPDNIHVAGRIEGEVPVAEIDRVFSEATKEDIKEKPKNGLLS